MVKIRVHHGGNRSGTQSLAAVSSTAPARRRVTAARGRSPPFSTPSVVTVPSSRLHPEHPPGRSVPLSNVMPVGTRGFTPFRGCFPHPVPRSRHGAGRSHPTPWSGALPGPPTVPSSGRDLGLPVGADRPARVLRPAADRRRAPRGGCVRRPVRLSLRCDAPAQPTPGGPPARPSHRNPPFPESPSPFAPAVTLRRKRVSPPNGHRRDSRTLGRRPHRRDLSLPSHIWQNYRSWVSKTQTRLRLCALAPGRSQWFWTSAFCVSRNGQRCDRDASARFSFFSFHHTSSSARPGSRRHALPAPCPAQVPLVSAHEVDRHAQPPSMRSRT